MSQGQPNTEVKIILDGKSYVMRSTFEALSRIERELGSGVMSLAKKIADGALTLEELATIIGHAIESDLSPDAIRAAILGSGVTHATQAVTGMFVRIFRGFHTEGAHIEAVSREELNKLASHFPDI